MSKKSRLNIRRGERLFRESTGQTILFSSAIFSNSLFPGAQRIFQQATSRLRWVECRKGARLHEG